MIKPTPTDIHWSVPIRKLVLLAIVCLSPLIMGANGCLSPTEPPPLSAEEFCALVPSIGYGNFFYCGTSQGNLQAGTFPDGSLGYCMSADQSLGLVGYSVTTYNGGATQVMSQTRASELSRALGSQSPGYIRCTRQ